MRRRRCIQNNTCASTTTLHRDRYCFSVLAVVQWVAEMFIERHRDSSPGNFVGAQTEQEQRVLVQTASDFILSRVFKTRYDLTIRLQGHWTSAADVRDSGDDFECDFDSSDGAGVASASDEPLLSTGVPLQTATATYSATGMHAAAHAAFEVSQGVQHDRFTEVLTPLLASVAGVTPQALSRLVEMLALCETEVAGRAANDRNDRNTLLTAEFAEVVREHLPVCVDRATRVACVTACVAASGAGTDQHILQDTMHSLAAEYSARIGVGQSLSGIPLTVATSVVSAAASTLASPERAKRMQSDLAHVIARQQSLVVAQPTGAMRDKGERDV